MSVGRTEQGGWYRNWGKRVLDLAIAAPALLVLSPLIAATALAVRLKLGSPVLFRQVRPGLHAEPFEMIKFRTMLDATNAEGEPLPDADRLTNFGRWLRALSLDELPELWNILRGDMSIVGPRPLLMQYLPLYSAEQMRRHALRPGLTGLAQVSGRNLLTWPQKFAADIDYVENCSPALDLKIIWLTFTGLLTRDGISAEGEATMPAFTGNADDGADGGAEDGTKGRVGG